MDKKYNCLESFILQIIFYISGMKDVQVCTPLTHGAVRQWRAAIAAVGVGAPRSQRVLDTLRCILSLI